MKKPGRLVLIIAIILLSLPYAAEAASKFYPATALTGGGSGALDAIDGNDLNDQDGALAITAGGSYVYILDADSGATESVPQVIEPDTNPGTKRWILTATYSGQSGSSDESTSRSKFSWKDADEIYVGAGRYMLHGTIDIMCHWTGELTKAITSPTGPAWYYLYLDDASISTAGTGIITAANLTWSTTAPTWTGSKYGWYNSNDRCIFAAYVNDINELNEFYHDGGRLVNYGVEFQDFTITSPVSLTWYDATCTVP